MKKIVLLAIILFLFYFARYTYDYVPLTYKFITAFIGGIVFTKVIKLLKLALGIF